MGTKTIIILCLSYILISCENTVDNEKNAIDWTKSKTIKKADKSKIPELLKNGYLEDAAILALRNVHSYDSLIKHTLVDIPNDLIEIYSNGLAHIYNSVNIPARDSVVSMYAIHAKRNPEIYEIFLGVNPNTDWISNWKEGKRLTGKKDVDYLMIKYNLQLDSYYRNGALAVLTSDTPLNALALSGLFNNIEGIIYVEPGGVMGDGDDIEASIQTDYLKFIFSVGYGDCMSGCIHRHYWVLHVNYDGEVSYIESYGDPAPVIK